jgi:diaminohydroxyphosphoribosylaminopyrimidine deaminase / 5-amino-6-(5-phosphoribosylamino)uracil reductase
MGGNFLQSHDFFMTRALSLARRGEGAVYPNPLVGAVIVQNNKIIGEGWHAFYGGIHAEQAALENCRECPAGADLYVTLEPCCHRGKGKHNPPCTEAIIQAGISRVIIARPDPNPRVSGKAIILLRKKGIEVITGIQEKEAASLNRIYESLIKNNRPYVHLKAAISLDGYIADDKGCSQWISGPTSRQKVMTYRSTCDALLVGRGTLFADKPSLTVRDKNNTRKSDPQPIRVFLSSCGSLPDQWNSPGGPVHIYHDKKHDLSSGNKSFLYHGVDATEGELSIKEILTDMRSRHINTLLVEGGARIFGSFLKEDLWDRLTLFTAPFLLGRGLPLTEGLNIYDMSSKLILKDISYKQSGEDMLINGYREEITCLPV